MAKKTEAQRLSDAELDAKIKRVLEIRPLANEYKTLCDSIKSELLARGNDDFRTKEGHQARIVRTPKATWLLEKLEKILPRAVFERLCPRKPDGKQLNQRLAAMPEDKDLAACRVRAGEDREVEVNSVETVKANAA